jgi:hypothetical protein
MNITNPPKALIVLFGLAAITVLMITSALHCCGRYWASMSVNPSKAAIAFCGLICTTILIGIKAIPSEQGVPIITMIVGYSVGNGMAALTNKKVEPIIRKKEKQ